ncbi:MAG: phenylacetate--CoA ligase family protein [Chloroflexota bacterium]|nr:phenylacetate--CoA ligase family protein [Chloroflexota bacterium]MDE3100836.1 phenylacetate--CoA ligase family protein [Chloroflexota bacterium]
MGAIGLQTWTDGERRETQRARLRAMAADVLAGNTFYKEKLGAAGVTRPEQLVAGWDALPFTTKTELSADQAAHAPWGRNLTYPLERYVRMHQTSGTTGRPLRILDTAESWAWWAGIWADLIYGAAGVTAADRVYFAFSFGPFIGFWSAFAGAERLGALCISGAAQSTPERLQSIVASGATVILSTPTYALRLAEVAREETVDLERSALRVSIHAGEPGASIPATRERIESGLGVVAFDHTGATEIGPTGFSCEARDGVHLVEREFIAEVLDPASGEVAEDGEGELVLTNLGRWGWPVIRYRTGDRVRLERGRCACGRTWAKLAGGIVARADDMVIVRGVNVFPSAIESIVRGLDGVAEYRVEAYEERGMVELRVIVEPLPGIAGGIRDGVAEALHRSLGIRCAVDLAEPGALPRFELKAKRFVRVEAKRP